jgi:glycosyltransferase involved in cell wall biosynthesis
MRSHNNVLVIVSEALGGGVYSVIYEQIKVLAGNFEIYLICSVRTELDSNALELLRIKGVNVVPLRMVRDFNFFEDFKSSLLLLLKIFSIKPDVVHLHSSKAGFLGRVIYPALKIRGIKVFYTPHCYGFLNLEFSKNKRRAVYFVEALLAKFQSATIACGNSEYEIAKSFGKSKLIKNGISDLECRGAEASSDFIVCSSGRDCKQKNPKLFLDIALKLPHIKFMWLGDLAGEVSSNVEVTGWISKNEVVTRMTLSSVYIQCSLWEGLAMAQIEAMGMSLPLLAYNTTGTRDPVVNGVNGYIFDNVVDASSYIENLYSDRILLLSMARNSRSLYEDYYSGLSYFELEDVYNGF